MLAQLHVLRFDGPTADWLDFVAANRKNCYKGELYDVVIGPVANDRIMRVVNDYIARQINQETALVLLEPQRLTDQCRFGTEKAVERLVCQEVVRLG